MAGNRMTSWIPAGACPRLRSGAGMTSWIQLIRDHIAANLSIEPDDVQDVQVSRDDCTDAGGRATQDAKAEAWMPGATDFEYAPFSQQGGLGKACLRTECRQVHQLFGDKLNTIIEELNETLAA